MSVTSGLSPASGQDEHDGWRRPGGITAEKVAAFGVSIEMTKVRAFIRVPTDAK
jgi:hypothetical protein